MTQRSHLHRNHDDRGAVVILVALSMVGIMIMAAIVLDLGQMRSTRRTDQAAADLAALAAGAYLSGNAGSTDQAISDPRGACEAALNSIKANLDDFPAAATINCSSLPATSSAPDCDATASKPPLVSSGSAPYSLEILYPVRDDAINESRFLGGGENDGLEPCERMQVTLTRTNEPFFAGVIGVESLEVEASATVRASVGQEEEGVAALLLLERVECGVINNTSGGSGSDGIKVLPSSPTNPGTIQSDSAGYTGLVGPNLTACDPGKTNHLGSVILGAPLAPSMGGGPNTVALPAANGSPGVIGLYSMAVGGQPANPVPTGVSPTPVPANPMSRTPIDVKYNLPRSETDGRAQISELHQRGWRYSTKMTDQGLVSPDAERYYLENVDPGGTWVIYDECGGATYPGTRVFINCPGTFTVDGPTIFPEAEAVVFNGRVNVKNNGALSFPQAQQIYVRGCRGCGSSGQNAAINVDGSLSINTGTAAAGTSCANINSTTTTELATFGGPLKAAGAVRMCQTFLYAGQDLAVSYSPHNHPYVRRSVYQTLVGPDNYPAVARCSGTTFARAGRNREDKPCPKIGADTGYGYIEMTGDIDWSAPNQLTDQPTPGDFDIHPFEDLAYWTESSYLSQVKGQGASVTAGVFFLPNGTFNFSGQGSQSQPLNAQFIARKLEMSGQSTLRLQPATADAVLIPLPGGWSLIR